MALYSSRQGALARAAHCRHLQPEIPGPCRPCCQHLSTLLGMGQKPWSYDAIKTGVYLFFSQWGVKRLMGLQQANPMESSSSSYCKIDRLNLSPNFRVETAKSTGWRHQLERFQSLGLGAGYCGFAKLQEDAQTSADFQIYPAATPRLDDNWNASLSQTARAIGSLDLQESPNTTREL